jgi:hypothetical protein
VSEDIEHLSERDQHEQSTVGKETLPALPGCKALGLPDDVPQPVRLPDLKRRIEKHHEEARKSCVAALVHAVSAGRWLNTAKQQLPHGEFHAWLEANFSDVVDGLSVRTCQRYMKVATNLPQVVEVLQANGNATRASQMPEIERLLSGVSVRKALAIIDEGNGIPANGTANVTAANGSRQPKAIPVSTGNPLPRKAALTSGSALNSSPSDVLTPPTVAESVLAFLGEIDLDPCAATSDEDGLPAKRRYTISDDGLSSGCRWSGRVFVHPPSEGVDEWAARTLREFTSGNIAEALLLAPVRTDSEWFRSLGHFPCAFLYERLTTNVNGASQSVAEPMVVIMVGNAERTVAFTEAFKSLSSVYGPISGSK